VVVALDPGHERTAEAVDGERSGHLQRLAGIASAAGHPVETLTVPGGQHSWLYEFPEYRSIVAAFLSRVLGGPYPPEEAAARAVAVDAHRLPDTPRPPTAVEREPGGFRSLVGLIGPLGPAPQPADDPDAVDEVVVTAPTSASQRGRGAPQPVASEIGS